MALELADQSSRLDIPMPKVSADTSALVARTRNEAAAIWRKCDATNIASRVAFKHPFDFDTRDRLSQFCGLNDLPHSGIVFWLIVRDSSRQIRFRRKPFD